MKTFGSLKTNLERVDFGYEDLQKYNMFYEFEKDDKNDTTSTKKRENGNVLFKEGKYREALDCYTVCILTAKTRRALSLAYANRSAALARLNLHNECLEDIERAFENGYPDDLKPKLIARRERSEAEKTAKTRNYEPVPKFPDSEKSDSNPNVRNCIKMAIDNQFGRHMVACRNIKIGEILAVDEPSAAVMNDQIYVHCHECFELCYNLIPCDSCTQALYCNVDCKKKAFEAYHKYECPILSTLLKNIDDPKLLALKLVFLGKDLDLETHAERRTDENLYVRAVVAAAIFRLVKTHTSFFDSGVDEDRTKELILKSMLLSAVNSANIRELSPGMLSFKPFATAIFPNFACFNHSCWPNVVQECYGSMKVLRAINSINKGEQCFISYGPHYWDQEKGKRLAFLAQHHFFKCVCQACERDWPLAYSTGNLIGAFATMLQLLHFDVNRAQKQLPNLLREAKKSERASLPGKDALSKMLLMQCYQIFGNKRQI
ncbi:SET, zf-MYND, and/or TPR 11 domain containing protein [Asbolus verrucosus]|uniref:Protein-lysine N-methyltransferase SMYD4 n=1 Tax=Asbolus verrucosus TaxID=1661398 RepID=A0A482V1Q6_ASBVE|nr:SET, zf-MYND, and/or TPR 11 domain containing protein [Asbolus verrucosus]